MRILLDECLNHRLRNHLTGHPCQSARYAGFGGFKNGELLVAAEAAGFDVLLTVDRGFQYGQNLSGRKIAVVLFCTQSIGLKELLPHVAAWLGWNTFGLDRSSELAARTLSSIRQSQTRRPMRAGPGYSMTSLQSNHALQSRREAG